MIKKWTQFNEKDLNDISEDKVKEIITELKGYIEDLNQKSDNIEELINTIEPFVSDKEENDQIDDSYLSLKKSKSSIDESLETLDNINVRLEDYLKRGRQYLY